MKIKLFSDTTCDLNPERRAELDITALPLHVMLGETDHLDGVDVTAAQLFDYANRTHQLPKTAAVSLMDFQTAFQAALDAGYDEIVYTGLSSELSATYHNACLAADALVAKGVDRKRFHLVDSRQLSSGTAQLLLRATDLMAQGADGAQIESDMRASLQRLSTSFIVDTLTYLHMGGRCSSIAYLAGSMLKMHPQINMVGGAMQVGEKFRGKLDHCIQQYKQRMVISRLTQIDPKRIFITSTLPTEKNEELKRELEALDYFEEVHTEQAGATIASHCGPGTIGYLYLLKD